MMRDLFPGYFAFRPQEIANLWSDATFAFDANVLLGLYQLTPESRKSFYDALEKLGDRIFLPNQAAFEYLQNRLRAISARTATLKQLKAEAEKFVNGLDSSLQGHDFPKGKDIIEAAKRAAQKITVKVEAALREEPDLVHSDDVLAKLSELFAEATGPAYDAAQCVEIYKEGATRYSKEIPPGYMDKDKREPNKYGDFVIWRQLIDRAASAKKSIVFITRDTKEDWWLVHNDEKIGLAQSLAKK